MAKPVALVAFGSTWTTMMIVAFRTQWLRSAVMLLLPMPCSSANLFVHLFGCNFNCILHCLWLRCPHPSMNHVHTFMKLHYWTLTLVVSQTSTFKTGASSLCSAILDYVANLLAISALYIARPIMVKFALAA
nr:hypothetical protein [Tanacetum cinerariifolium]